MKVFDPNKLLYQIAKNGLTYTETAQRAGLHHHTVAYLCNGKKEPAKLTIFKLAVALNCEGDDLMKEVDEPEKGDNHND